MYNQIGLLAYILLVDGWLKTHFPMNFLREDLRIKRVCYGPVWIRSQDRRSDYNDVTFRIKYSTFACFFLVVLMTSHNNQAIIITLDK